VAEAVISSCVLAGRHAAHRHRWHGSVPVLRLKQNATRHKRRAASVNLSVQSFDYFACTAVAQGPFWPRPTWYSTA
jgi:hypothetical protein